MKRKAALFALIPVLLVLSGPGCEEPVAPINPTYSLSYTLKVTDFQGNSFIDLMQLVGGGIKVNDDRVKITASENQVALPVSVVKFIDTVSDPIVVQPDAQGWFRLLPGNNSLYVRIWDAPSVKVLGSHSIRIFFKAPIPAVVTLKPATLAGEPNEAYTFTAEMENEPVIGSYEWRKNGELLGKGGGKTLTTRFNDEGTYKISVVVYDRFTDELVGTGEATVTIRKP